MVAHDPTSPTRPRPGLAPVRRPAPSSRSLPAIMNACGLSIRSQTPASRRRSQFWQCPPGWHDALRRPRESRAVVLPVDDDRHPPAGDVVPAQLEQAARHRSAASGRAEHGSRVRRSRRPPHPGGPGARPRTAPRPPARWPSTAAARSPRPAQLPGDGGDRDARSGRRASMSSKSARSVVTLSAMP